MTGTAIFSGITLILVGVGMAVKGWEILGPVGVMGICVPIILIGTVLVIHHWRG